MPMTPAFQFSPTTTSTRSLMKSACSSICASASAMMACSWLWRIWLWFSSSLAILRARSMSCVHSISTDRDECPMRPPALMRGPSAKPMDELVSGFPRRPATSISASSPGRVACDAAASPACTSARFSSVSDTMSATVPMATMSR